MVIMFRNGEHGKEMVLRPETAMDGYQIANANATAGNPNTRAPCEVEIIDGQPALIVRLFQPTSIGR
jgi:hypothetical protein